MKSLHVLAVLAALAFLIPQAHLRAQDDGRIVFRDPKSPDNQLKSEEDMQPRMHSFGVDLMIGNDGFGLGTFYIRAFNDALAAFASISLSEVKDGRQIDFYDYWGSQFSPNKVNRVFRIPLFVGLQYRLFKDDIVDNFRPYINGGAGPVMLYVTSAEREFFSSLSHGSPTYTYGGFVGTGAQFGFDRTSVLGLTMRYYIIPLPKRIQGVQEGPLPNANGFFIALNFGLSF